MKVILKEKVEHLGEAGEVKEVKKGYFRNFLNPRGLAILANKLELKKVEELKAKKEAETEKAEKEAEKTKEKIEKITLTIESKVGKDKKLFGAITPANISEELKKQGFEISKKDIEMEDFKEAGEHKAKAKLSGNVSAIVNVKIIAAKEKATAKKVQKK